MSRAWSRRMFASGISRVSLSTGSSLSSPLICIQIQPSWCLEIQLRDEWKSFTSIFHPPRCGPCEKRLLPLAGEWRSDFFNLDPQRWAGSGGVCGFSAERQRKTLLISILVCRALLQRESPLPLAWLFAGGW